MSCTAVGVLVEPPAVDDGAVLGDGPHGPVDRHHLAVRVEQRALERRRRCAATPISVRFGPDARAGAPDAVTLQAAAFAFEDRPAARASPA